MTLLDNFTRASSENSPYSLANHISNAGFSWGFNYNGATGPLTLSSTGVTFISTSSSTAGLANTTTSYGPDVETSMIFTKNSTGTITSNIGLGVRCQSSAGILTVVSNANIQVSDAGSSSGSGTSFGICNLSSTLSDGSYTLTINVTGNNYNCYFMNSSGNYLNSSGAFSNTTKVACVSYTTNNLAAGAFTLFFNNINTAGTSSITVNSLSLSIAPTSPVYSSNILFNNSNLNTSPYNSYLDGSNNLTLASPGSYLTFTFVGEGFYLTILTGKLLTLRIFVDGLKVVDSSISSADTTAASITGLSHGTHQIKIVHLRRNNYNNASWDGEQSLTASSLTLISNTGTTSISAYTPCQNTALLLGDSITEGLLVTSNDLLGGSSTDSWGSLVGAALNCEYGVVGWGGLALAANGSGGIPPLYNSWNYILNNISRNFSIKPKYIFVNIGTNDSLEGASIAQSDFNTFVSGLRTSSGSAALIIFIIPFGGFFRSQLNTAINSYLSTVSDSNIKIIDLGLFAQSGVSSFSIGSNTYSVDGVHPNAENNGRLASMLMREINKLIMTTTSTISKKSFGSFAGDAFN